MNEIEFAHHIPRLWLFSGILLMGLLLGVSYVTARNRASGWRLALFIFLRFLCIAGVLFILMAPYRIQEVQSQIHHQDYRSMVILEDVSASMSLDGDRGQTRYDTGRKWLENKFIPHLPAGLEIRRYEFRHILERVPEKAMAEKLSGNTSIAGGLMTLAGLIPDEGLGGVVLISDGADHSDQPLSPVLDTFRSRGIPIHTLTIGKTENPADAKIADIRMKEWSKESEPAEVEVTVEQTGLTNAKGKIKILQGIDLIKEEEVVMDSPRKTFLIRFNPPSTRSHLLKARVDMGSSDVFPVNDMVPFSVELNDPDKGVKRKIRVLYLHPGSGGYNGWYEFQYQFLKSGLELDPEIECTVLQGWYSPSNMAVDYVSVLPGDGYKAYHMKHPVHGFPRTYEDLMEYDVVVNGSVWVNHFTPEMQKNLVRFVEEGGGGYFVGGGDCTFGTGGYLNSLIEILHPVVIHQRADIKIWGNQKMPHFTPEGMRHPVMQMDENPEINKKIWEKFPDLTAFNLVKRAKPGAIVLAENPNMNNEYGPAVLLAVQEVGRGRTMGWTSGIKGDWGIRFMLAWGEAVDPSKPVASDNCDRRYYNKFWNNIVRWLAAPKLDQQRTFFSLISDRSLCVPGETFGVRLILRDMGQYKDGMSCRFSLMNGENLLQTTMGSWDASEKSFKSNIMIPETGDYFLIAELRADGKISGERRILIACREDDREMMVSAARPGLMAQIAGETGGKVLSLDDDFILEPSRLSGSSEFFVKREKKPLWDNWWMLATLIGLLSAEWAARRLSGMA